MGVTVPMGTEPTPQPALQLSGDVSYLQDLMAGVPDLASEGSSVALPVAHAVAPEFESQDTAWGSGLEESSFAGASTQSGLKMAVAKVPNLTSMRQPAPATWRRRALTLSGGERESMERSIFLPCRASQVLRARFSLFSRWRVCRHA